MLNSEYKLSKSSVQSQQHLKSYQKQPNNHGIHCPILILVPSETLTAITSYLDPPSLSVLAVVNVYLNGHVKDDNTWRRAFFYQFLGINPENDLDENKALLLRRTEGSWRNEFTVRYKLKRRWERSRNAVTTHVPVNSPISSMHVMPSHALLTSSIQYGIVARSLPLTGKILPSYLDTSGGARVGLGIGNPNAEFTPNISACAISSDGGTAKIVWGTTAGDVIFINAPRAMDGGRRNAADVRRCDIADKHGDSVLDAQWVANPPTAALGWTVVTASADGRIKLWDAKTAVCQWTSQRKLSAVVPDPCLKVTAIQTGRHGGCIATVMQSGEIHIWRGFALDSTAIYEENSIGETIIECLACNLTCGHNPQMTHTVIALHIDPNPVSASPTLLVAYENDPFFYRIRVGSQPRTGHEKDTDIDITTFGDPFFGSTSTVVPYFRGTAEQQSSFVLVGDHLGWVSLYAWDADNPISNSVFTSTPMTTNTGTNNLTTVQAIRKFEAHPDSASITALTWSPHTLITGSAKGTTHVFDALNFRHLRSFASPIPKTRGRHQGAGAAAERDRQKVKQIIVGTGLGAAALNFTSGGNSKDKALSLMEEDRDLVFISVGERVMAWKAGPVPKHGYGGVRGRHTQGVLGVGKKKRTGYAKYLQQLEVNQTILESRHDHHQLLLDEQKHKKSNSFNPFGSSQHARETEREQRERLEHLGLSEIEAVEYVLMLSRDEANPNARAEGGSGTSTFETQLETDQGMLEGDFDTEHATDNDEEDDYNQSFTVSGSWRSSTSSTSIPTASSSHSSSPTSLSSRSSHSNSITTSRITTTRSTTIPMHRSIPRPIPSSSNEKIQVSPPLRSEPMEAGQEWLSGYNAVSSASDDVNTSMREGMEAHIFPPIIPSGSGNAGYKAQGLKREDDGKERETSTLKGRKKNRDREDNIEDTHKNKAQERNKATMAEISSPSPSSRLISNTGVGISRIVNQNALTPSSPSSSVSAWNVPLSIRRGSIVSRPSSTSTSAFASAVASTAPRNVWTSGGPSLSARISPPTAAAATSLPSQLHYQAQQ